MPKGIVSYVKSYTPNYYYQHFVLNFLQSEHQRLRTALVQKRANGALYVTKKDIEEENPNSKEFLRKFSLKHPHILELFKARLEVKPLQNNEIVDINIAQIAESISNRLTQIPTGNEAATEFHNLILGALELLFYPDLVMPVKEQEIHQGRKRIDIMFENASSKGILYRLQDTMDVPCSYVSIECKNYTKDIANPELDQIAGRFSPQRGKLGFIVCRKLNDRELFIQRCRDTHRDQRGLIIILEDADILDLLAHANERNRTYIEEFLSKRVREIIAS